LSYQTDWVSDHRARSHRLTSLVGGGQIANTESRLPKRAESDRDGVVQAPPDLRVRAAATASLENYDWFGAVEALRAALRDPNPEVVAEGVDSLEFAGDASSIRHLEPLLAHEDSRVREAASEAIDFLED